MLSHRDWPHRMSPSVTQMLTTNLAHAQSEESGIEPGPIATITGSLYSFPANPDHYDTDHTDLASEPDEVELKRELLRDQWRQFFDKYDPEGFGEIPWGDLVSAINEPEFRQRVGTGKREILLEKARGAKTPAITFQDFVNVIIPIDSRNLSAGNVLDNSNDCICTSRRMTCEILEECQTNKTDIKNYEYYCKNKQAENSFLAMCFLPKYQQTANKFTFTCRPRKFSNTSPFYFYITEFLKLYEKFILLENTCSLKAIGEQFILFNYEDSFKTFKLRNKRNSFSNSTKAGKNVIPDIMKNLQKTPLSGDYQTYSTVLKTNAKLTLEQTINNQNKTPENNTNPNENPNKNLKPDPDKSYSEESYQNSIKYVRKYLNDVRKETLLDDTSKTLTKALHQESIDRGSETSMEELGKRWINARRKTARHLNGISLETTDTISGGDPEKTTSEINDDLKNRSVNLFLENYNCSFQECTVGSYVAYSYIYYFAKTQPNGDWTNVAIGITNSAQVKAPINITLYKGVKISEKQIMEYLTHSGYLVIFSVTGARLLEILEHTFSGFIKESGRNILSVAGITMVCDQNQKPGSVVQNVTVMCRNCSFPRYIPINKSRIYHAVGPKCCLETHLQVGRKVLSMNETRVKSWEALAWTLENYLTFNPGKLDKVRVKFKNNWNYPINVDDGTMAAILISIQIKLLINMCIMFLLLW